MHTAAPAVAKVPVGHSIAVGDVDPGGHAYPAVQLPVQAAVTRPVAAPYLPPGHGPLQVAVVRPEVLP